jgi:hypothetical protein
VLFFAGVAGAEIRRMEAVGTEPIYTGGRRTRPPRDAAVQLALLEAVSRVASEFLPTAGGRAGAAQRPGANSNSPAAPDYSNIFGRNLVQYTARYRIMEDRGEGPALFATDSRIESEYVVVVEVHVDTVRVRGRLEEVGLVAPQSAQRDTRRILLEVHGLHVYPAYEALREVLLERIGAAEVMPLEFTQDRVRLGVDYRAGGPAELLDDLYAKSPKELEITPVLSDDIQLTISVEWAPRGTGNGEGIKHHNRGKYRNRSSPRPPAAVDAAPPVSHLPLSSSGDSRLVDMGTRNRY